MFSETWGGNRMDRGKPDVFLIPPFLCSTNTYRRLVKRQTMAMEPQHEQDRGALVLAKLALSSKGERRGVKTISDCSVLMEG